MSNSWIRLLQRFCLLAVTVSLAACDTPPASSAEQTVRLAVVNTPNDSGLLSYLLADFEATTGLHVEIHSSEDPFDQAMAGKADLVISHYGKSGLEKFVTEGYGSWPNMVFANQAVLIGPEDDPAGVKATKSLAEAFSSIANSGHTLIANSNEGINELTALVSTLAGLDMDEAWYQDLGVNKGRAIKAAEKEHAYVIWGAIPFLKFQAKHDTDMVIVVSADPLLQRVMASTRVNKKQFPDVNDIAATELEDYLLSTDTQAKVMSFRVTGSERQLWWPAARHN